MDEQEVLPGTPEKVVVPPLAERNYRIHSKIIIKIVAKHYELETRELTGPLRKDKYVIPRTMVVYLIRRIRQFSFTILGKALGGRDHSSVAYLYNKAEGLLKSDEEFRKTAAHLTEAILATLIKHPMEPQE